MRLAVEPLLGFALLATLGCANALFDFTGKESALKDAQRRYTELVRWGAIADASAYVDPAVVTDYLSMAELFQNIRFSDFESGPLQFGEGSNTATVDVVYYAYSTRTLIEKRVRERQEWYREASAANSWRVRPNLDAIVSELSGSR
ncbi:MAG: hypothetical protein IH973_08425 [Myxococcales bacterium]|nr:hypothetical protein [Myxococcales bacterium]